MAGGEVSQEMVAAVVSASGLLIAIATFVVARIRDAEARGRILQRIEEGERKLARLETHVETHGCRLAEHDTANAEVKRDLEHLTELVQALNVKVDRLLERRE